MEQTNNSMKVGMIFISLIFFIFGFVTTFIITLSAPVKEAFDLNYSQAFLVNSAFFLSFMVFSIPCGSIVKKIGYKKSVVAGLFLVAIGGFMFYPAINLQAYAFFLASIFVLASGVVLLQTAANPYVAILGPPETASGRLNLTQALNSVATWIAPLTIAMFIVTSDTESSSAQSMQMPFIVIGIAVLLIGFGMMFIKLPEISQKGFGKFSGVFRYKRVILGAIGIFCYVGAEVGTGTTISSYIVLPGNGGVSKELATLFVGIYWAGAMIGRFFGAIMLSDIKQKSRRYAIAGIVVFWALLVGYVTLERDFSRALIFAGAAIVNFLMMQFGKGKTNRTLATFAIIAAALATISMFTSGPMSIWTVVLIGLFNSIMFPNIFALAVEGLDKSEMSIASGIINTLIVGGAAIPPIMGIIGDTWGIQFSFIVPVVCYLYILFFATIGSRAVSIRAEA